MGMLINGHWSDQDQEIKDGAFERTESVYAAAISPDVCMAITAEPGRYHLIASYSCPWSHRTMLLRALNRLEAAIPLHIAHGPRDQGYRVGTKKRPWRLPGSKNDLEHLHQVYRASNAQYTGRSTVPVLWDSHCQKIVSNESTKIIRALDAVPAGAGDLDWTLRPPHLAEPIDQLSTSLQVKLSNGVYRAGMAQRQDAYDEAVRDVFQTLDELEARLERSRYLHGLMLSETDIRLWPTLARFDCVYYGHFKCSTRRLVDYPNLWGYARDLYSWHGFATSFNEPAIRRAYYGEDQEINPFGIIAAPPDIDWTTPHDRGTFGPAQLMHRDGSPIAIDPASLRALA